jgi:hypothetical protein
MGRPAVFMTIEPRDLVATVGEPAQGVSRRDRRERLPIASKSDSRVPSILVVPTPIVPLPILNHRPSPTEVPAQAAPTNGPDGRLVFS